MSKHDLQSSAQWEEHAAIADALRLRSQQRSRRTIELPGINTRAEISHLAGKSLTNDFHGLDHNRWGKNAGKECVQCAAVVSAIFALITVMMERSFVAVVVGVMDVKNEGSTVGAGQR